MSTRMSYQEFEQRYLPQASWLTRDCEGETARKLCRMVYDLIPTAHMLEARRVNVKLAEAYYDALSTAELLGTELLFRRIYGDRLLALDGNWVSLEEALHLLSPILCQLALPDRIIGAVRCLGWEYTNIATLYDAALSDISQDLRQRVSLKEASILLARVRKAFCSRVIPVDSNHPWLCTIIEEENDASLEIAALMRFREVLAKAPDKRFARPDNTRDQYGWLRDRWRVTKELLLTNLDQSRFLQ